MSETKSQADKFRDMARELESDESDDALDKALAKLDTSPKPKADKK